MPSLVCPSARQILRYALRQHRQRPAFAALVVLILALGTGASTALFSMVKAISIAPLPYPDSERLVTIREGNPQRNLNRELVTPGDYADWKDRARSFEDLAFSPAWSSVLLPPSSQRGSSAACSFMSLRQIR